MMKTILIALLALTLTNCAQNTYKVKQEVKEEGRVLNQVPQWYLTCLLYTSPSPRDPKTSRMPSSA